MRRFSVQLLPHVDNDMYNLMRQRSTFLSQIGAVKWSVFAHVAGLFPTFFFFGLSVIYYMIVKPLLL